MPEGFLPPSSRQQLARGELVLEGQQGYAMRFEIGPGLVGAPIDKGPIATRGGVGGKPVPPPGGVYRAGSIPDTFSGRLPFRDLAIRLPSCGKIVSSLLPRSRAGDNRV